MIKMILRWVMALVATLIALFLSTGCRSSKGAVVAGDAGAETVTIGSTAEVAPENLPSRFTALANTWKPWKELEVSAKAQISSPAKLNGAAKVYMKRGQWISVSVRMLGFEVATLWLDNDSIVAIDKFHKKYVAEPIGSLFGGAGVTVAEIQDLLLGRAFLTGHGTVTPTDASLIDLRAADNGWYILPKQQPDNFTYGFLASLTENELRGAAVDVDGYGAVTANYSDYFESRTCGWFAQTVSIENSRGKKIAATLKWDMNGAKFNSGVAKTCRIPEGYERIPASALASLLKSF